MELYIIENYKDIYPHLKGSESTDKLICDCLIKYGIRNPQIKRTNKGKPYVCSMENINISVSHSGDFFVCIICDVPVGIDIQQQRKVSAEEIAKRYFTEEERKYIEQKGEEGFFILWTRKEAYSKLTGEGLSEIIRGTSILDRKDVEFTDMQIEPGIWCSYCVEI